jgi:hypothetical protein
MGKDKKRGATYSWLVQHLADARGETTPREFLTALRATAQFERVSLEHAIDYRGIQHGVAEASENRVDDLLQDYWWIDIVKEPLAGPRNALGSGPVIPGLAKGSNSGIRKILRA